MKGLDAFQDAHKYIRRIRNQHKRAYAWEYDKYCRGVVHRPREPQGLSCMAAQAVRMQLDILYG